MPKPSPAPIAAIREFNRFYTQQIGVLGDAHLDSPYSLTEVRVLYEIARHDGLSATDLSRDLALDPGYLSRILTRFTNRRLVSRTADRTDGRKRLIRLTATGRGIFAALDERATANVAALLAPLSAPDQATLIAHMHAIQHTLSPTPPTPAPIIVRTPRPGDLGWVVHRHGVLYAQEYGWDERFEAIVADVVAEYVQHFDPKRDRAWIADRDGDFVGSIFLVHKNETVAKLRLLLVEPSARGLGIGRLLVDTCIDFARDAGYKKITLWTNDVLHAARAIYERAGFQLVDSAPHTEFGEGMVGETWELTL